MAERRFFMVWRDGGSAPTFQHTTRDSAVTEAVRLAEKSPGVKFYIMESVEHVIAPKPTALSYSMAPAYNLGDWGF